MKTKFFTLVALVMLGLVAGVSESKAQSLGNPSIFKISIRVLPNPANEEAKIETILPDGTTQGAKIGIFNSSGQIMYSEECNGCGSRTVRPLNIKTWPAGMYIARLVYANRVVNFNFVVF